MAYRFLLATALLITTACSESDATMCEAACARYDDGVCSTDVGAGLLDVDSDRCIEPVELLDGDFRVCSTQTCGDGSDGCQVGATITSEDGVWDAEARTLTSEVTVTRLDGDIGIQFEAGLVNYDCQIGVVLPDGGLRMAAMVTLDEANECGVRGVGTRSVTLVNGDELSISVDSEQRIAPACNATEALINEQLPRVIAAFERIGAFLLPRVRCADCSMSCDAPVCINAPIIRD